ncbi:uncharacterized protein ColSpa_11313 [Colletotrichum spaethianum]|uniref:Uncharacterized protein n=1 Tax=Colletotrichum spaethianum TaxID=700344 RepID=A0AA37PFC2_9PEZI|nr:uncharacterized protein ColSpa_11313 [Colletotrichum spaethianum]GKT51132.1 hypothetical protein ColSpa_11313 [Colletotrichum spaethianum]
MAPKAPLIPMPVILEEDEEWEDASSSDDNNTGDDEHLSPPPGLLFPQEAARQPPPPTHAPRLRLMYHSQTWDTQIYMLKDGKVLKERASYARLCQGYFGAVEMYQMLRHWFRLLPEQLEDILGKNHPYISRVAIAAAPRQHMLIRSSGSSDHLPDQLVEPFPEMNGRLVMERVRPIKAAVIRVIIDKIINPTYQRRAIMIPENYNLHPKTWLGFEQPAAVKEMLRDHPNLSTRPAYLDQLLKFIGRPGVLELAREMGTALAVIHYDLKKDARNIKFRIGYNHTLDKAKLWVCGLGSMAGLKVNEKRDGFVGDPAGYV